MKALFAHMPGAMVRTAAQALSRLRLQAHWRIAGPGGLSKINTWVLPRAKL
jgi:hypothetical protein